MRHNRDVMLVAWRDKRIVRVLSTLHRDEMRTVMVRKKDKEELQMKQKPVVIVAARDGAGGELQPQGCHPVPAEEL